ncbi:hypothetical protein BSR28_00030 [Boudabousia liubingyangii]|nr:hypothetical protein BSR28_00030 [Boudabousia liubingyangii]
MAVDALVREQVFVLRRRGHSFGQIALEVGLSRNTVKSLCRRQSIGTENPSAVDGGVVCEQCGQEIEACMPVPRRRFCSATCRLAWWHAHPEHLNRRAIYSFTCAHCGQVFSAYGNKGRKYCCHSCYVRARFGTKGGRR